MTNGLSASDHVRDVIRSCGQTLYALRVLRVHGMCHAALQAIFRSVAIAKLLYAASAWIGFTKATDRQRVDGFLISYDAASAVATVRQTLLHLPNSVRLWMNNHLIIFVITRITYCTVSFLHPNSLTKLPSSTASSQPTIPQHTGHLTDSNFITRMLFTDIY